MTCVKITERGGGMAVIIRHKLMELLQCPKNKRKHTLIKIIIYETLKDDANGVI